MTPTVSLKQAYYLHLLYNFEEMDTTKLMQHIQECGGELLNMGFPAHLTGDYIGQVMRVLNPLKEAGLVQQKEAGMPFILTPAGRDFVVQWNIDKPNWVLWIQNDSPVELPYNTIQISGDRQA